MPHSVFAALYGFLGLIMLAAVIRGTRIAEPSRGRIGWLADAWFGPGESWVVFFSIGLWAALVLHVLDGVFGLPQVRRMQYSWPVGFHVTLYLTSLACAASSRALGVWIGLTLRRRFHSPAPGDPDRSAS